MKAALCFVLLTAAAVAGAAPEEKAAEPQKGVDLLTADHTHDGRGNLIIILPDKTPFDTDAEARKRYQQAFGAGFRSGYTGILFLHDPEIQPGARGELEGWSAGQWAGYRARQKDEPFRAHR